LKTAPYKNSTDIRKIPAVIDDFSTHDSKDDSGDVKYTTYKFKVSYVIDGKTYKGKCEERVWARSSSYEKKYTYDKLRKGDTIDVEVYKTSKGDYKISPEGNPVDFLLYIQENKEEIYFEDSDGNKKSYVPPRYTCDYEFNVTIRVDSPWFDEIELELSDGNRPDSRYTDLYREHERRMHELEDILMRRDERYRVWDGDGMMNRVGCIDNRPEKTASVPRPTGGEAWVCSSCGSQSNGKFCSNCGAVKPVTCSCCENCGWSPADGQSLPKFCPECGRPLQ